jgi:LysM repeat protein
VTSALPTATRPNTPTPSPTPIIHVVQSGETLIAIALQYGVTVPALQSANGIDDPASLQVNQALIIPVGEESRADTSDLGGPTPTPVAFAIEGFNCQEEPVGSLWCLGEVVNSTQTSLENVRLRVSLHNAAGQELMGGEAQSALDLVPSGERAPFGILFTSPPEDATRYSAHSIRAEASSEPGIRYAALAFDEVEAGPVGSLFEVTGQVTNPGQRSVTAVMVVVTTYDSAGMVTGFRQARLAEDIPAGGSVPFAVSLMPQDRIPENYALGVQGRPVNP